MGIFARAGTQGVVPWGGRKALRGGLGGSRRVLHGVGGAHLAAMVVVEVVQSHEAAHGHQSHHQKSLEDPSSVVAAGMVHVLQVVHEGVL